MRDHADELIAANNPALETFKSRKGKGASFIPGKGMRDHEDFLA